MPTLAQIDLKKPCMKNELRYVKQRLWCYEYDYKCNHYSLVTPTVAVNQLHVTSYNDSTFLNLMHQAISVLVYTVLRKAKCPVRTPI